MSSPFDYLATFGDQPSRITRGRVLAGLLDLDIDEIPAYRDAWVEKWQNPDREPGVGPMMIVLYLEIGTGPQERRRHAVKIFTLRAHPQYRSERDDVVATGFACFYFATPTGIPDTIHATMAARAVDPVDTDARWAAALGITREGKAP